MGFQQLWMILRARAGLIGAITLGMVTVALLATLMWPKIYEAAASVVIDTRGEGWALGANYPMLPSETLVSTHRDLIAGPAVALKVVERLGLEKREGAKQLIAPSTPISWVRGLIGRLLPGGGGGRAGSVKEWMALRLIDRLSLSSNRDSRLIRVAYSSPDPDFSAEVANAFVHAYRDTLLQLRAQPAKQSAVWFEAQLKELKNNLQQAEAKMSRFQQEKGIVTTDERLDLESARLTDLSQQLVEAQSQSYEGSARQQQLRDFLGKGAEPPSDVWASPIVAQRQAEVADRESKLNALSQRLGRNHPELQAAEREVARARARLRQDMRQVAQGLLGTSGLSGSREAAIRSSLQEQREKVLKARKDRADLALLMQEVESARRVYDSAMQRYQQTRLEGDIDQTSVSSILDTATPPDRPTSPNALLNLGVALVLGLGLGIGVVLFLETLNRYVRSEADIVEVLGVPVLAVLAPKLSGRQNVLRLSGPNVYRLGR